MLRSMFSAVKRAAQSVSSLWKALRLQQFVAIAFVGLFLLTTSIDSANLNSSTKAMLNDVVARGEAGRPKTAGQWKSENQQLEGQPGKKVERIAKESADAVGEMGEIYPGNAKSVLPGMKNKSLERDD